MEIVAKINKLSDIKVLSNVTSILLPFKQACVRYENSFTLKDILFCKSKYPNLKINVLMNKIMFDEDISYIKDSLKQLKDVDIDGIYFADFAVFNIASSLSLQDKCVFFHETFARNSKDINTLNDLGIKKVICSKDMSLSSIGNLDSSKKNNYGVVCFGYVPLYYSKRLIIDNFKKVNNLTFKSNDNFSLSLKELTRDEKYKVLQQSGQTTIFNHAILSYANYIKQLKNNLNIFVFDCLYFKAEYIKQVIDIFITNDINAQEMINKLDSDLSFTTLFLLDKVGVK